MSDSKNIQRVIDEIVKKIVEKYSPDKIILYGSYAYGEPTDDSDIDLFILKATKANRTERWVEVKKLLWDKNRDIPVSPLVYTPDELRKRLAMGDFFVKEIANKGKVLYERAGKGMD
ncbi:MAG: nucleotidyltransferase domain-containing protein [bacterium]